MVELPPDSLAHLLLDHPIGAPEPLVCSLDAELTKAEVVRSAEVVAAHLHEEGVEPGHSVGVQLPGSPRAVAVMFGVWLAGAVLVPINPRQRHREVREVCDRLRPAALIDPTGIKPLSFPATYDTTVALVTWTSGTTGQPRPILQTHSGYREILRTVLSSIPRRSNQTRPNPNLIPMSLALNAGIYNLLFGLMAGSSVVTMERFEPSHFSTLVARYGVRSTVLPPAAMTSLVETPEVTDLSPLKFVRSITAPLSPLQAQRFIEKFGVTVLNGYGQAEVGEVIGWTAADARMHPEKLGAAGRPHPGVAIKVVDGSGQDLPIGCSGQLMVRPVRMAAGYGDSGSLNGRIDRDGYIRTGDYAIVDSDGFVWIDGRESDMINRGGNKIFPEQVEEVLLLLSGVKEAAVVGVPDPRLGEVPVAFIVGDASEPEMESVCRENLAPYKIPICFERIESLPRTEVGKIIRRELTAAWTAQRPL